MTITFAVSLILIGNCIKFASPTVLIRQNPQSHYLNLPEGWRRGGLGGSEYAPAQSILGPKGEVIYFPLYGSGGLVATAQKAMDYHTRFLRTVIDGQRIDVALTFNNLLAVSYSSADYWTQIKDTRQAVVALMIFLTRLDVLSERSELSGASTPLVLSNRPDYPFERLQFAFFSYDKSSEAFVSREGLEIREAARRRSSDRLLPEKPVWQNETALLHGLLQVIEDNGTYVARFTDRDGKAETYASSDNDPANAMLAILASITRVRH